MPEQTIPEEIRRKADSNPVPRHQRWAEAQRQIDALPRSLTKSEFRKNQAEIWRRLGL